MNSQLNQSNLPAQANAFSAQKQPPANTNPAQATTSEQVPHRMRELFAGRGKAEKDLGQAPIPPLWVPGPPAWWN